MAYSRRGDELVLDLSDDGYSYFAPESFSSAGIEMSGLSNNFLRKPNTVSMRVNTTVPVYLYADGEFVDMRKVPSPSSPW